MSRSDGINIFKHGSIEEMTGEQYAVLLETVFYTAEQERKAVETKQDRRRGHTVRVVNK